MEIPIVATNVSDIPVITGRSGGIEDAVVDGETVFHMDPYNKNELAEKIIELLTDKEKAEKMGETGRKRAVKEFDWTVVAKRFDGYL